MHTRQKFGGLDRFRVVAALLVIAIHTSPLSSLNEEVDFFLTRVLARTAVPFFFMVTGQFVVSSFISATEKSTSALIKYLKKVALLYAFCIVLYLPIGIYAGHYQELTFGGLLRMLLFDGTFYHLWYFPACILGISLLYLMSLFLNLRGLTIVSAVLYLIGLFGDSYFGIVQKLPALKAVYEFGFRLWSYTRNGLFLAPLFMILGVWISVWEEKKPSGTDAPASPETTTSSVVRPPAIYYIGLAVSLTIMTAEAFTLRHFQLQYHDSMYLALIPTMVFLYLCLISMSKVSFKGFRTASTWIYILHPALIVVVRGFAKILHLTDQLVNNSVVHYLVVAQLSVAVSLFIIYLQKCVLPRFLPILQAQIRQITLRKPKQDAVVLNKKGIPDLHKDMPKAEVKETLTSSENNNSTDILADVSVSQEEDKNTSLRESAAEDNSSPLRVSNAEDNGASLQVSNAENNGASLPESVAEDNSASLHTSDGENDIAFPHESEEEDDIAFLRESDDDKLDHPSESEEEIEILPSEEVPSEDYILPELEAGEIDSLIEEEDGERDFRQEPEEAVPDTPSRKPIDLRNITLPNIRRTPKVMPEKSHPRRAGMQKAHALPKVKSDPFESPSDFRSWVELDAQALEHNVTFLRSRLPEHCRLMPAIKADAYGHGAVIIARQLNKLNVTSFCVACLSEGITLRKAGIKGRILILGYTPPNDFPLLSRYLLTQAVIDHQYAQLLNGFGKPLHVHVAVDTGMHRIGIRCENLEEIVSVYNMNNLIIDGLFTHLSVSDSLRPEDRNFTESQVNAFYQVVNYLKKENYPCRGLHLLASYGILNLLQKRERLSKRAHRSSNRNTWSSSELAADYVRPGIALYGLLSTEADTNLWRGSLRPVLSLKARVISVRTLYTGEAAGYGTAFTAKYDMRIATLSIGYADGLPRELSYGIGNVLINGCMAPIIGRICMDQTIVDVSNIPRVQAGNIAVIIGKSGALEITADHVAEQCGTITNEILSRLGSRLDRVLL